MSAQHPQPHLNTPQPILADECLLPGGARVVAAPADGWTPRGKLAPQRLDDAAWWTLSLGTSFMAGVMICLLVVAVMFKIGGARIVLRSQPTSPQLLDMADTMAAQELREGPGGSGEASP